MDRRYLIALSPDFITDPSDLIVTELHPFDRVYAARPPARGWRGEVPRNWFDVQDWQYERWLSAGHAADVADMQLINRLIEVRCAQRSRNGKSS